MAAAVGAVSGATTTAAQAAPTASHRAQPPFSYAACLDAAKQHGESRSCAKWHCDLLVTKGRVRPPKR
ncbi:hypothetical protein [Streptomyces sp. NPDC023838]|uniref:hypothetical protein n=1 Tax=Streptomyces sp. NPDC023838 TaxID=3154325 RepID=UPI0033F9595C